MNDDEMARRLRLVAAIYTRVQQIRNEVREVGADFIDLVSERSHNLRRIYFDEIRNASSPNGCIIEAMRQVLGMA